jgi:hypothetical protein
MLGLRYLLTASVAFLVALAGCVWLAPELSGHYYHPRLVALTHTATLGWITLTIMGATYQLVPVVLERPLWSERLTRWQFLILVAGLGGMIAHFYIATWFGLVLAAVLTALGVALHVLNAGLSMRGLATWGFTERMLTLALFGLALTALFGLVLGSLRWGGHAPGNLLGTLHAHFHLAMLGWVAPMVMGVSARLYPMFFLAAEPGGWPARVQLWGLGLGTPTLTLGLLAVPVLVAPGAVAVSAAVIGHLVWVSSMAAERRRPALDWGLRFVLTGTACLLPALAMGLGFSTGLFAGPRLGLGYAVLVLGGWASLTMVGVLLKIIPFLVWYRVYGPRVGRGAVPALGQLSFPTLEMMAYGCLTGGMAWLVLAAVFGGPASLRVGAGLALAGALAFAAALGRVLSHLVLQPARDGRSAGTIGTGSA